MTGRVQSHSESSALADDHFLWRYITMLRIVLVPRDAQYDQPARGDYNKTYTVVSLPLILDPIDRKSLTR